MPNIGTSVVRNADFRYHGISEDQSADLGQQQEHTKENNISKRKATLVKEILHNIRMCILANLHYAESFNHNHHTWALAS